MKTENELLRILEGGNLPSFPSLLIKLYQLHEANADYRRFEDLINTDAGLTVELINCSNAAHYSSGGSVSTLKDAFLRLGETRTIEICTAKMLSETFKDIPGLPMITYWRLSLTNAILTRRIYLKVKTLMESEHELKNTKSVFRLFYRFKENKEETVAHSSEYFNLGLLANIGLLVQKVLKPYQIEALHELSSSDLKNAATTNKLYELSNSCLRWWGFGGHMRYPYLYLENPRKVPEAWQHRTLVLSLALTLAEMFESDLNDESVDNELKIPHQKNLFFFYAIDRLGLNLEDCEGIVASTKLETKALLTFMLHNG